MCSFFSFLADKKHNFYYFSLVQRLSNVKFKDNSIPMYNSHASIAKFYGINEDDCNKYEYNLFTDKLTMTQQSMENDREEALSFIRSIDWRDFCDDLEGARKFITSIKDIQFMQNNPDFDLNGCEVFDTRNEAYYAAIDDKCLISLGAKRNVTNFVRWNVTDNVLYFALEDIIRSSSAREFIKDHARFAIDNAVDDLALYCVVHYISEDLQIPQEYIDYADRLYSIWLNGYGVVCDIDGIFYVYRKIV